MSRSFRDLQKGIPELEVYEDFGKRIGEIHYKKLMALFIADRNTIVRVVYYLDNHFFDFAYVFIAPRIAPFVCYKPTSKEPDKQ